ncbi:hypothetical protein Tco_0763813 [Tanacetum coccineum]
MPRGTTQVVTRGASNDWCAGTVAVRGDSWTNQRVTRGTLRVSVRGRHVSVRGSFKWKKGLKNTKRKHDSVMWMGEGLCGKNDYDDVGPSVVKTRKARGPATPEPGNVGDHSPNDFPGTRTLLAKMNYATNTNRERRSFAKLILKDSFKPGSGVDDRWTKTRKKLTYPYQAQRARYLGVFGLEELVPSLWVESEREYDISLWSMASLTGGLGGWNSYSTNK